MAWCQSPGCGSECTEINGQIQPFCYQHLQYPQGGQMNYQAGNPAMAFPYQQQYNPSPPPPTSPIPHVGYYQRQGTPPNVALSPAPSFSSVYTDQRHITLSPAPSSIISDSSLSCQEEVCSNPRYKDARGYTYPFCSGTVCATLTAQRLFIGTSNMPDRPPPSPSYSGTHTRTTTFSQSQYSDGHSTLPTQTTGTSIMPGRTCRSCLRRPKVTENGREYPYCGGTTCLTVANRLPLGEQTQSRTLPPELRAGPIQPGSTPAREPRTSNKPETCIRKECRNPIHYCKTPPGAEDGGGYYESYCEKACYWLEVAMLKKTKLDTLDDHDLDYYRIKSRFEIGLNTNTAKIKAIIRLQMSKSIANAFLDLRMKMADGIRRRMNSPQSAPEKITHRMYHGTTVDCGELSIMHTGKFCKNSSCGMCRIAEGGIKVKMSKHQGRMYFTNNPIIAAQYTGHSKTRAIFIVDVLAEPEYLNAESISITNDQATLPRFLILFDYIF